MTVSDYGVSPDDVEVEAYPSKDEQIRELENKAKSMVRLAVGLGVVALASLALVVGLLVNRSIEDDTPDVLEQPLYCGRHPEEFRQAADQLGDPSQPGVFHALTVAEILRVNSYLETEYNVSRPNDNTTLRDRRIHMMDLELPPKATVLDYLDNNGPQPDRYARVVLYRGDLDAPEVQELLCGPLDNITCSLDKSFPFSVRPFQKREYGYEEHFLIKELQRRFGQVFSENFNASFDYETCEQCLNWWEMPVGSNIMGVTPYVRRVWFMPMFDIPYFSLHSIGIGFLCNIDGVDEYNYSIEKVWFNGNLYGSPEDFLNRYNAGTVPKLNIKYPTEAASQYSSMETRGTEEERFKPQQRPPRLIEPDGKRYTVHFDRIQYMGLWSFHYRISPIYGPGIYDVRFKGERIAYEISTQEILVQYSGAAPMFSQCNYIDTAYNLGSRSKATVLGADCPSTATHLRFVTNSQDRYEPAVFPQGACVFEQNTGRPLRRHHSYSEDDATFYGGMLDSVLTVRSIHTVDNYDYVLDFTFHQNGALGVKIFNTGYLLTSFYYDAESKYGAEVAENIFGPVHFHSVNFKVDMDINGVTNRYQTLDVMEETVTVLQDTSRSVSQTMVAHSLKTNEDEAAYTYNFQSPKYHIFYNENVKNRLGVRRAYRLVNEGKAPQLTTPGAGNEKAFAWSQYQMAVTKRNETERYSSSPYNQWETTEPYVNFNDFINGESIRDEDLVAWVTLSSIHIPHTEDLPVTPTPGQQGALFFLPYNYFTEDPSMTSPDSVYLSQVNRYDHTEGFVFDYTGSGDVTNAANFQTCQYVPRNWTALYARDPDVLFASTYDKGIY